MSKKRSSWLRKIAFNRVDLVDAGANPDAHIMLFKSEGGEPTEVNEEQPDTMNKNEGDTTSQSKQETNVTDKELEVLKAQIADTEQELAEAIAKRDEEREAFEKRVEAAEAQAAAAEAEIAKLRDERDLEVAIEKARKLVNLPVDEAVFGQVLLEIGRKLSPENAAKVEEVLAAANETVGKGALFVEKGSASAKDTTSSWDDIQKAAEARVTAGTSADLTTAIADFLNTPEGAALYSQYLNEKKA